MQGEEVTRLHSEAAKVGKMREQYIKKLTQIENKCRSLEQEKEKLKGITGQLEKDLDTAKKQAESDKKTCDDLQKERDVLNKNILKATGTIFKLILQDRNKSSSSCIIHILRSEILKCSHSRMEKIT
jgi:TolA-binding protein